MFKSIFSKLLSVNFIIIIISFLMVGILMFGLLWDYATSEKTKMLTYTSERINEITNYLIENNNGITQQFYQLNLEAYGTNTQSLILVTKEDGTVLFISNAYYKHLEGKKLSQAQYGNVILGKEIKTIGTFEGMFDQTVLTIGRPLTYHDQIIGTIFLHTPIPEINRVRYDVLKLFMVAVAVALSMAFVLIFFLSRRLSQPLKMINKAAKTIADGQFQNRVSVDSQDEIGELAQTFNSMAESLQNLEEMRKSFIANVSHELRTPMTSITGFIEGILDGTVPVDRQKQYLTIVLDETKRLSRLVNDLLDLAKMEAGENQLHVREFDINEMIRVAIIKFENKITQKDIHVNAFFESEQCMVSGDVDSIQRIITNLLDNAIKFCKPNGDINISVKTKANKAYISVQDSGVGIAEDELKYVWDRFYKTDKSRGYDKTGTGLGLAIVKNIIYQHQQEIWVESRIDEYTKFTFTLDKA